MVTFPSYSDSVSSGAGTIEVNMILVMKCVENFAYPIYFLYEIHIFTPHARLRSRGQSNRFVYPTHIFYPACAHAQQGVKQSLSVAGLSSIAHARAALQRMLLY